MRDKPDTTSAQPEPAADEPLEDLDVREAAERVRGGGFGSFEAKFGSFETAGRLGTLEL